MNSNYNKVLKELGNRIKSLRDEAKSNSCKTALVLTVTTQDFGNELKIFPNRSFENYVCLPIGIRTDKIGREISKYADGKVDAIFVDIENKIKSCKNIFKKIQSSLKKSKIYAIKGNDFTADSAFSIVLAVLKSLAGKKICVIGAGNIGSKVALKLLESGAKVFIINSNKKSSIKVANAINTIKPVECDDEAIPINNHELPGDLDCVIGFTRGIPVISKEIVSKVKRGGLILDGGTGTIYPNAIQQARKRGLKVFKVDIRMGFNSNANFMLNVEKLVSNVSGTKKMKGFNMVAGCVIGDKGDVIVDDISKPTKVLGVADGKAKILANQSLYKKNIDLVNEFIRKKNF